MSATWIAVGEGPGENERRMRRPFIGASGTMLQRAFGALSIQREQDVHVTNALLCSPPGASDADKEAARVCCAPRLRSELADLPGRPVLLMGALAAKTLQIEADPGPIEVPEPDDDDVTVLDPEPSDVIEILLREVRISKIAGSLFTTDVDGSGPRHVIPTIHPAHILRGGNEGSRSVDLLYWNLVADIAKVHRLGKGLQEVFKEDILVEYEDPKRAYFLVDQILGECRERNLLALDLETTSLRAHEAEIRAIGLGHPGRSICVTWDLVLETSALELIRDALADDRLPKVIHNRIYDRPVLRRRGFVVRGLTHDTLLLHHVTFPGLPHDLQRVATQVFAIPPWKAEYRGREETLASLTRYCAIDTLACARLTPVLGEFVSETKTSGAYRMYSSNAAVAERMMLNGIPFDPEVNQRLDDQFATVVESSMKGLLASAYDPAIQNLLFRIIAMEQAKDARKNDNPDYLVRVEQRVRELVSCVSCSGAGEKIAAVNARCVCEHQIGKHDVSGCTWSKHVKGQSEPVRCECKTYRPRMKTCSSCDGKGKPTFEWRPTVPAHVVGLLKARRVPLFATTPTGKVSTKRLFLEQVRRFPEVDQLLLHREASKMLSTFVRKVKASAVQEPGGWKLYPRIKVHMITGRWAFEDPMVQNWPRENRKRNRPNLRAQVVAPPGYKIVGFDYDKQEARVIALLSGDEFLNGIFERGENIHEILARAVWPNTFRGKKQDPELYDFVKRTEYGGFYEGSVETLWANLLKDDPKVMKVDVERAVEIIRSRMPGVTRWQARKRALVATPPHVLRSLVFGLMRIWPLGNASPTEVANWDVQTAGAEIMAQGFMRFEQRMLDTYGPEAMDGSYPIYPNGAAPILQVHDAAYFIVKDEHVEIVVADIEATFPQEIEHEGRKMKFSIEVKVGKSWSDV